MVDWQMCKHTASEVQNIDHEKAQFTKCETFIGQEVSGHYICRQERESRNINIQSATSCMSLPLKSVRMASAS